MSFVLVLCCYLFFFFKQKTAYEMRISDWSSDVCSSDLTFGTVGFDESRTSHVHVRARGWIERLHARVEGETVTKGQLLLEFFSPELITAAFAFVRELHRGNPNTPEIARRKLRALGAAYRKSTRLNSSHSYASLMTSPACNK